MTKRKTTDDGYRGIYVYYQKSGRYYPIEILPRGNALIKEEREEEKIESEVRGIVKSIFSLLLKLGEIPDVVRVQIQGETNQEILLSYLNKAATSKTMDKFLKSIQQ